MLFDTASRFLWVGDEIVLLDDNHANVQIFSCRTSHAHRDSPASLGQDEGFRTAENIVSIPVYQFAQVALVPTAEQELRSVSLIINESLLTVVDRCGGILKMYTEENIGYSLNEIHAMLRLSETRYLLFVTTDVVELDLERGEALAYREDTSVQTLHMSNGALVSMRGAIQNINVKYIYGPEYLYLLTMISNDIYLLKVYNINGRSLVCQIFFYQRIISLQAFPGAGNMVGTESGKIYLVSAVNDAFTCTEIILKGMVPDQNVEHLLLLRDCVAMETETKVQYLYSSTWLPDRLTLTLDFVVWSDDSSLAAQINAGEVPVFSERNIDNRLHSKIYSAYLVFCSRTSQPSSLPFSTDNSALSPSAILSGKKTGAVVLPYPIAPKTYDPFSISNFSTFITKTATPSSVTSLLPQRLAIHINNKDAALLIALEDGLLLTTMTAEDRESSFVVQQANKIIFSEIVSVILGHKMPLSMVLNVNLTRTSDYNFLLRLLNLSTGSSFEFPFASRSLTQILLDSSEVWQPPFRSYGVFALDDYLVILLLGGRICICFYVFFKTRMCQTVEVLLDSDVYFTYPLVKPIYKAPDGDTESNVLMQYMVTYYMVEVEMHPDAAAAADDPAAHAVSPQRTLLSFYITTRTHILTTFRDATFRVIEMATIIPVSIQYEIVLQGQSKILQVFITPYFLLSDSSFVLVMETNTETYFYLVAFDPQRGTTEASLLEHDIALVFLRTSMDTLKSFGYVQMSTFHIKGLIDFYVSGALHQRFRDKVSTNSAGALGSADGNANGNLDNSADTSPDKARGTATHPAPTFSDALLKGTLESLLSNQQGGWTPKSPIYVPDFKQLFENVPSNAYATLLNVGLASINDQTEKLILYKQYNPYFSTTAVRQSKRLRTIHYSSVDNEIEGSEHSFSNYMENDLETPTQDLLNFDDGKTSILSLEKKLNMLKKNENYAGEYSIQPMKAKVTRFTRLHLNLASCTSKQSIDYKVELDEVRELLAELETRSLGSSAIGMDVNVSVPMTPGWVEKVLAQFSCSNVGNSATVDVQDFTEGGTSNAVQAVISTLLHGDCANESQALYSKTQSEALGSVAIDGRVINSNSSDDSSIGHLSTPVKCRPAAVLTAQHNNTTIVSNEELLAAMYEASAATGDSILESTLSSHLPQTYHAISSLGFFRLYNSLQKILATILITPLKRLYNNILIIITEENGLLDEDFQSRLRLGSSSTCVYQNIDFYASDLINCREILHLISEELALHQLYRYQLSFTLSCLSALVVVGVLHFFLREADRRPLLQAVEASIVYMLSGCLQTNPGELPSMRLVFSFLILDSPFSKFAATAFIRLLTARLTHLSALGAIPETIFKQLVLATHSICQLNFSILMCQNLLLMHVLVVHREIFSKVILILETLTFMKDPAIYEKLDKDGSATEILSANLDASLDILYKFRNNLADSNFKRFSPEFASYFLRNLSLLFHTFCTYARYLPGLQTTILLKTLALHELMGSPHMLNASCRGLTQTYRDKHIAQEQEREEEQQKCHKSTLNNNTDTIGGCDCDGCDHRLYDDLFTDIHTILTDSFTTLSMRSLYAFVVYLQRYEPQAWDCHAGRLIQLMIFLMQRLSTLERVTEKFGGSDLLTTLPLERIVFDRKTLLSSLREKLFDLSYSNPSIALVRFTVGNDISVFHGLNPGLLTIKFLESATQTLNLEKTLVSEASYTHFLASKSSENGKLRELASLLPPFTGLGQSALGASFKLHRSYECVLPSISFISVDPHNEFVTAYAHNYRTVFIYKISISIDDVYLLDTVHIELPSTITQKSKQLLVAQISWREVKKTLKSFKQCDVTFVHSEKAAQKLVEAGDYIWKTRRHTKALVKIALFSVTEEQEAYEKRQQEERRHDSKDTSDGKDTKDGKDSSQKTEKRHGYHVDREKAEEEGSMKVSFKLKRKLTY